MMDRMLPATSAKRMCQPRLEMSAFGVKQTSLPILRMSVSDPKRTLDDLDVWAEDKNKSAKVWRAAQAFPACAWHLGPHEAIVFRHQSGSVLQV